MIRKLLCWFRKLLCWLGFHTYVYDCVLPEMKYNSAKYIRCDWHCWVCKAHKKVCKYCKKWENDE